MPYDRQGISKALFGPNDIVDTWCSWSFVVSQGCQWQLVWHQTAAAASPSCTIATSSERALKAF